MCLFRKENFISHSGKLLTWKIECNALKPEDYETLSSVIASKFKFNEVIGIPRGGIPLENALKKYIKSGAPKGLIVDDVLTTGGSMKEYMEKYSNYYGIVLFNRGGIHLPEVYSMFELGGFFK